MISYMSNSNNDLSSLARSTLASSISQRSTVESDPDINSSLRKMNQVKNINSVTKNQLNNLLSSIDSL